MMVLIGFLATLIVITVVRSVMATKRLKAVVAERQRVFSVIDGMDRKMDLIMVHLNIGGDEVVGELKAPIPNELTVRSVVCDAFVYEVECPKCGHVNLIRSYRDIRTKQFVCVACNIMYMVSCDVDVVYSL